MVNLSTNDYVVLSVIVGSTKKIFFLEDDNVLRHVYSKPWIQEIVLNFPHTIFSAFLIESLKKICHKTQFLQLIWYSK